MAGPPAERELLAAWLAGIWGRDLGHGGKATTGLLGEAGGKSCSANLRREGVMCACLGQSVSGNTNPLEPT